LEDLLLDFKERSYSIVFRDSFLDLPKILTAQKLSSKFLIITDTNVDFYYGEQIKEFFSDNNCTLYKFVFEAGEKSKNLNTISQIYDQCIEHRLDRSSAILALGGGVVGDIAGFAASTYMRGIPFIQIPTSLLAQVDSSVGGKVGVDFKGSKNLIGAFYQPALVYMNLKCLRTLPKREYIAGLAEVIKHGIIYDMEFFSYLENNVESILSQDFDILKYLVKKNCMIKADVVQQDEKELGLRAILNFGHTIGHAIESIMDFSLLHGECVSIGMVAASYIACRKKLLSEKHFSRIVGLVHKIGLPTKIKNIDFEKVYGEMLKDKKQKRNVLKFILPVKIGKVIQTTVVTKEDIFEALEYISS
jgi:3-dehydroquinate synthase